MTDQTAEAVDTGADVSPEQLETSEEVAEQRGQRRYELDPEPEAAEGNEAESPPAAETDSDSETGDDEIESARKLAQDRIDKLTERWRNAERQVETLQEQLQHIGQPDAKPEEEDILAGEPKTLADFDYDDRAFTAYVMQRSEAAAARRAEQLLNESKMTQQQARVEHQHAAREADFSKKAKDYHDVVYDPNLPITKTVAEEAKASDHGPDILYYLGKHPDVALELSRLPEREVVRRIARIENVIGSALNEAKPKPVSNTPPPAKALKGGTDPGNRRIDPNVPKSDDLSDEEWLKRREAQIAKRRR